MDKDKKSLNDILQSYQSLEMMIIENEGEVDHDIEGMLQINEVELKDKLDGYQGFVKYLEGQINYLKLMEAHYLRRRRILEKQVQRCRDSMVRAFSITDSKRIKTLNYNFTMCESESWSVDDEHLEDDIKDDLLDKGLAENIFKLSMSGIKSKYKNIKEDDRPKWIKVKKNPYIRTS